MPIIVTFIAVRLFMPSVSTIELLTELGVAPSLCALPQLVSAPTAQLRQVDGSRGRVVGCHAAYPRGLPGRLTQVAIRPPIRGKTNLQEIATNLWSIDVQFAS